MSCPGLFFLFSSVLKLGPFFLLFWYLMILKLVQGCLNYPGPTHDHSLWVFFLNDGVTVNQVQDVGFIVPTIEVSRKLFFNTISTLHLNLITALDTICATFSGCTNRILTSPLINPCSYIYLVTDLVTISLVILLISKLNGSAWDDEDGAVVKND